MYAQLVFARRKFFPRRRFPAGGDAFVHGAVVIGVRAHRQLAGSDARSVGPDVFQAGRDVIVADRNKDDGLLRLLEPRYHAGRSADVRPTGQGRVLTFDQPSAGGEGRRQDRSTGRNYKGRRRPQQRYDTII